MFERDQYSLIVINLPFHTQLICLKIIKFFKILYCSKTYSGKNLQLVNDYYG